MFVLIGAGLSSFLWAISAGKAGAWPIVIFALSAIAAARSSIDTFSRTPLDLPLTIFLGTAVIGVWAAYDRDAAQYKFWMLVGACLVAYIIAIQPAQNIWRVAEILAHAGLVVALAFLFIYVSQIPLLNSDLARDLTNLSPASSLPPMGLEPSIFGSALAVLLPFQLALTARAWRRQRRRSVALPIAAAAVMIVALCLVAERSIIVALAFGLSLPVLWHKLVGKYIRHNHLRRLIPALLVLLLLAAVPLLAFARWQSIQFLDRLAGAGSILGRAQLASQTLDLIGTFPFTGAGLATFPGLHARYILGIPYFFLPNGHNLLLDVTLEQGILATAMLLLIMVPAVWRLAWLAAQNPAADNSMRDRAFLSIMALSSLLIMLFHGQVEDAVYGATAIPLLFVAPAFGLMLERSTPSPQRLRVKEWDRMTAGILALAMLAFVATILTPQGRAYWHANLGAIDMARIGLSDFPTDRWVEAPPGAMLQDAERHFEASLQLDPRQRTARYRLGMLALQRNDFQRATEHLQIAYTQDPYHIGIQKALGYSYAWSGDTERARELLLTAPFVSQELEAYITLWRTRGRQDLAETAAELHAYLQLQNNQTVIE